MKHEIIVIIVIIITLVIREMHVKNMPQYVQKFCQK